MAICFCDSSCRDLRDDLISTSRTLQCDDDRVGWDGVDSLENCVDGFLYPYTALGLELTTDYHERTRLFAWRQMIMTTGFAGSLYAI